MRGTPEAKPSHLIARADHNHRRGNYRKARKWPRVVWRQGPFFFCDNILFFGHDHFIV